jgi:hypothetical protein
MHPALIDYNSVLTWEVTPGANFSSEFQPCPTGRAHRTVLPPLCRCQPVDSYGFIALNLKSSTPSGRVTWRACDAASFLFMAAAFACRERQTRRRQLGRPLKDPLDCVLHEFTGDETIACYGDRKTTRSRHTCECHALQAYDAYEQEPRACKASYYQRQTRTRQDAHIYIQQLLSLSPAFIIYSVSAIQQFNQQQDSIHRSIGRLVGLTACVSNMLFHCNIVREISIMAACRSGGRRGRAAASAPLPSGTAPAEAAPAAPGTSGTVAPASTPTGPPPAAPSPPWEGSGACRRERRRGGGARGGAPRWRGAGRRGA